MCLHQPPHRNAKRETLVNYGETRFINKWLLDLSLITCSCYIPKGGGGSVAQVAPRVIYLDPANRCLTRQADEWLIPEEKSSLGRKFQ